MLSTTFFQFPSQPHRPCNSTFPTKLICPALMPSCSPHPVYVHIPCRTWSRSRNRSAVIGSGSRLRASCHHHPLRPCCRSSRRHRQHRTGSSSGSGSGSRSLLLLWPCTRTILTALQIKDDVLGKAGGQHCPIWMRCSATGRSWTASHRTLTFYIWQLINLGFS